MEISEDEFLAMQKKCEAFDLINYSCQGALDNYTILQITSAEARFDAQQMDVSVQRNQVVSHTTRPHNVLINLELLLGR